MRQIAPCDVTGYNVRRNRPHLRHVSRINQNITQINRVRSLGAICFIFCSATKKCKRQKRKNQPEWATPTVLTPTIVAQHLTLPRQRRRRHKDAVCSAVHRHHLLLPRLKRQRHPRSAVPPPHHRHLHPHPRRAVHARPPSMAIRRFSTQRVHLRRSLPQNQYVTGIWRILRRVRKTPPRCMMAIR